MKQTILFLCFALLFLCGCHTPKKLVSNTKENITTNEKQNEVTSSETYNFADTTKKSDVEVNYFKIEFYPPAVPDEEANAPPNNSILPEGVKSNVGNTNRSKPPNQGAIKSIEGYTIKAKSEEAGINESQESSTVNRNEEKNEDINKQVDIKEQPAADPYRWRYIFGIVIIVALLAVGIYFVFRKSKFVISVMSFLKAFFVS
ncbi:MAG: hypothetical protein EZS26_000711 [Candidatus Ordinivivax streblomastigis]|uniref:Lipoprotein n=1 Tax=Candidatus Ordinivivax streblomastigis TaxID=2540710 RepID=A0A5M8P3Z8_9BACT|nr:MAG: hypothetical protein EZS26_000711 [Candidatus Ordinivivax streblomastigis]